MISFRTCRQWGSCSRSSPQYYLACHSIELILKAFILIKGGTEDEVREIRHDLLKAWERATELGLCPKDNRTGESMLVRADEVIE
jgi:hypothetical protein